jgi:RNA polymerase subunit RPABC4/transcription elongation factor Spt4
MTQTKSKFRDEIAIIPQFLYPLAIAGFACILYLFVNVMPHHDPKALHAPASWCAGIAVGTVVAIWVLLIGYVNQDAKRRGMGQLLWTLLAMFVPNMIGLLAYFLLRKPLPGACPKCSALVEKGFSYCPKCGCGLSPTCSHCGQAVQRDFVVCPYCGKPLAKQGA